VSLNVPLALAALLLPLTLASLPLSLALVLRIRLCFRDHRAGEKCR
jgi:hypothetical protein